MDTLDTPCRRRKANLFSKRKKNNSLGSWPDFRLGARKQELIIIYSCKTIACTVVYF